jgi:hypothetical protein
MEAFAVGITKLKFTLLAIGVVAVLILQEHLELKRNHVTARCATVCRYTHLLPFLNNMHSGWFVTFNDAVSIAVFV